MKDGKGGVVVYNEEEIEDSIRFCKEMDTYYKTGCFTNPKNVFDWEEFLPIAKAEVEQRRKDSCSFDDMRLQEAISFTDALLNKEDSGSKTHTTNDSVRMNVFEHSAMGGSGIFGTQSGGFGNGAEKLQTPEGVTLEQLIPPEHESKKKVKAKKPKKQPSTDIVAEEEEEEISFGKIMLQRSCEVVFCIGIAFVLSAGYNHFIGTHTVVEGTSMETTLHDEDNLAINKIGYRFHNPERYDIVVFPYDDETYYIKRIIGLPNETVQIINGRICINGKIIKEDYGLELIDNPGNAVEPIKLGADEYFVLGDNRNQSKDSRSSEVGLIKRDKIIGKAVFRFYPFDTFGKIE